MVDTLEYKELFEAEAAEYMQSLNNCLLDLEKEPDNKESVFEAFRMVHSLKGMSATMGYRQVADIAHGFENFLQELKSETFSPTAEVLDLVFETADLLQSSLDQPEAVNPEDEKRVARLLEKMQVLQKNENNSGSDCVTEEEILPSVDEDLSEPDKEIILQAVTNGQTPFFFSITLKEGTAMKSVRSYQVLKTLEDLGEIVFCKPSRNDLDDENFDLFFQVGFISNNGIVPSELEKSLTMITDIEKVTATVLSKAAGKDQEITATSADTAETAFDKVEGKETNGPSIKKDNAPKSADKSVRVETHKLDELVNLVGEMVVARTQITEVGTGFSSNLDHVIDQLKQSITGIQDAAMSLRMVPIKQVFDRFPRMMRDLCRESKKDIDLVISGESTELDRAIINQLSDPLVHLLRNAADHGIEDPEARKVAGKDARGTIHLSAHHEGSKIIITVEDDGAGINREKITAKAIAKGLVSAEEAAEMSDQEAFGLIFQNGFSTAEKISDVSGRGVGMDVVRKSIQNLHGSIELDSKPGLMSRVVLKLPLTMAIIKTLMVGADDQVYAIPMELVIENVCLDKNDLKTIRGNRVIKLRDEVIPLYQLQEILGCENLETDREKYYTVIVEAGDKKAGFIVDELIGQQEIMIKSINDYCSSTSGISGATILGNGTVSLIVDVYELLKKAS